MFTCLCCNIAFPSHTEQRDHYRADIHRYNLKRRVAGLPPVSAAIFAQKLIDRTQEPPPQSSFHCDTCGKSYSTQNAYASHINSKKHKDSAVRGPSRPTQQPEHHTVDPSPASCLFCDTSSPSLEDNLSHMSAAHSFFIPDADYLVDVAGLVNHLADKIAVHNVCIFCNGRGRGLHSLDAVRKHMLDKAHCKIAYDTEVDRLDISDFYDFTPSYPDAEKAGKPEGQDEDDDAWEDIDQGASDTEGGSDLPQGQLAYGDTEYELVLPSGARIGHRSMMRYYAQSFHGIPPKSEDPNTGAGLVRRLLADKHSALIPRKGGFGAFGQGTQVVKARNRGEAREAGRHIREFRDQRRKEDFKTRVGFVHNHQKHFRDPLLQ